MVTKAHEFIPMSDGTRLAATMYYPDDGGPWPALLEALPYRKDDITASYRPEYLRLAEAGYVMCRVDVRGTGSSEGIATDEYPLVERTDMATVIEWLATRDWSTGNVGMFGTSYSGFNSIQVAMERPPALKAIIPIYATDDRFADDVHYVGGAMRGIDVLDYPCYMIAMNALPPVPSVYGDGWREVWEQRVKNTEPWLATWLSHQRFDDYWQAGSLRPDYGAIECAVMIIAGWADGYRNNTFRTFETMTCPKKLVVGPWAHSSPETSVPGPNLDMVSEYIRWWDHWLKGIDNGIDREPPITVYAQRSTLPATDRSEVRGAWRWEPEWPPARLSDVDLRLDRAATNTGGSTSDTLSIRGDVGWTAWISCASGMPWGQSDDQRPDEAYSLTYTWDELTDEVEILGYPTLRLAVTSSTPVAFLGAKLCDVFPDGTSSMVTRGLLNLAHRDDRRSPTVLEPGREYQVELDLEAASWTFEPGHRIRLDLATADWPNAWAPPSSGTLSIDRESAVLALPVLSGPSPVAELPQLPPARTASSPVDSDPADHSSIEHDGWVKWEITHDQLAHETRAYAGSFNDYPADGDICSFSELYGGHMAVSTADPGEARADAQGRFVMRFPEATCESHVAMLLTSTSTEYQLRVDLTTSESGEPRWQRHWNLTFPRDHQ